MPPPPAQGKVLLKEALAEGDGGGASAFFEVMSKFEMQKEPVSCGLASLAISLNVLHMSPWRGEGASNTVANPVTEDEILGIFPAFAPDAGDLIGAPCCAAPRVVGVTMCKGHNLHSRH